MKDGQLGPAAGVVPHISVDGAAQASDYYQRAFAARELARIPAQDGKRLIHCHLEINGGSLMLNDHLPEYGSGPQPSHNYTMHLQVEDVDAWWARALEAGAEIKMPLEVQFWGDRYGQLRDPFGVQWSLGQTMAPTA